MSTTTVRVVRLTAQTIYKTIFLGTVFSFGIFCAVMGVLAAFGANTVSWNGAHVHGLGGLVTGVLIGAGFVVGGSVILGTACVFGTWLYSKFETVSISYLDDPGALVSVAPAPIPGENSAA